MPIRGRLTLTVGLVTAALLVWSATSLGTASEKLDAIEAAERIEQALPAAVAPSQPQKTHEGDTVHPSVTEHAGGFDSRGAGADSEISADAGDGFKIQTESGPLAVRPTDTSPASTDGERVGGDAVVYANTGRESDTVVRPTAEGVETFTSLRSEAAAEAHSWTIDLAGDERLQETSDGGVEVIDPTPEIKPDRPEPQTQRVDESKLEVLKASGDVAPDAVLPDPDTQERTRQLAEDAGVAGVEARDALGVPQLPEQPQASTAEPTNRPADVADEGAALANEALQAADRRVQERVREQMDALDAQQAERNAALADAAQDARTGAAEDAVVVATIKPAWAKDAEGKDVPTELSVEGDTVTMTVEHHDGEFAYPIVADPWVVIPELSLEWACCLPIYQWQWRYSHQDANWHHAGNWFTAALIDAFYDYGWGPSRGWWGWHNVQLPGGWLTMPYWGWGPMYYLQWYPVHTWQPVVVGWMPYLRWVIRADVVWEDDLEWAEEGPEASSGLFVSEHDDWETEGEDYYDRAALVLPVIAGVGLCAKYCDDVYRIFRRLRKVKPGKIKHPRPGPTNQARASSFTSKAGSNPSRELGTRLGNAARMRRDGYCAHHIVAVKDRRAAYARAMLEFHGILPNEALNGVWLKCGGIHRGLHTNAYYANLNTAMRGATLLPRWAVENRLKAIARSLDHDVFPH